MCVKKKRVLGYLVITAVVCGAHGMCTIFLLCQLLEDMKLQRLKDKATHILNQFAKRIKVVILELVEPMQALFDRICSEEEAKLSGPFSKDINLDTLPNKNGSGVFLLAYMGREMPSPGATG